MGATRSRAFWELCREGLPQLADTASECWNNGKLFELRQDIQVSKSLRKLLDQANWEAERTTQN